MSMKVPDDLVPEPKRGLSTFQLVLVVGGLSAVLLAFSIFGFAALQVGRLRVWRNGSEIDWFSVVRAAVTTLGAAGIGVGGALAYRRQLLGEKQLDLATKQREEELARDRRDHVKDVVARRRDRFASATAQLADASVAVRIAGVYSLAALVDEWLTDLTTDEFDEETRETLSYRESQVSLDVLCAYLRTPAPQPNMPLSEEDPTKVPWDVEVRQTIVRVIAGRFSTRRQAPSGPSRHVVKPGPWSHLDLDFTGARFHGEYDFSSLTPLGRVQFRRAHFGGGTTYFNQTDFLGATELTFENVTISNCAVRFSYANFGPGFTFHSSRVVNKGSLDFSSCVFATPFSMFEGLSHLTLTDARLTFADIRIDVGSVLDLSALHAERSRVSFSRRSKSDHYVVDGIIQLDSCKLSEGSMLAINLPLGKISTTGHFVFEGMNVDSNSLVRANATRFPPNEIPNQWPTRELN